MRRLCSRTGGFLMVTAATAMAPAETNRAPSASGHPVTHEPVHVNQGHRAIRPEGEGANHTAAAAPSGSRSDAKEKASSKKPDVKKSESDCPADMQLIDGDYCTKVEHKCLESWYDKSNKKTVCEKFEAKSTCVGETKHKRYCMDRYEWPNRAGERPEVMNKFHQAEVKCAAIGKRLCTESEWTMACEGPKYKPFPYGYVRDTNICHGDVMWDSPDMKKVAARDPAELARLWKGVRSGSQPECVSDYGIYDMPGNADEVVSSETFSSDFRGKFDSVHTGGPWYKGVRNQCRPKIYTHDEGFYYYFLSFRCCAEPDQQPTDPRTTKQRKDNWKFEKVEQIAGFTRAQVQKALKQKEEKGNCACTKGDVRCNTICGTLLGPEAKDFPKGKKEVHGQQESTHPRPASE